MNGEEVRRHLVDALQADAVGPFLGRAAHETSTEALELAPSRWYLAGFLAPLGDRGTEITEDDDLAAGSDKEEEESAGAEPEPKQRKQFPASMGMSVLLPPRGSPVVHVRLGFAEYRVEHPELPGGKKGPRQWRRHPRPAVRFTVPLDRDALNEGVEVPGVEGVRVRGKLETVVGAEAHGLAVGTRGLSLFVVNERPEHPDKARRDERFLFQVELEVEYADGLVARPNRRGEKSDEWDENVADLQFRDRCEHAVGHNVSVEVPGGQERVTRVRTTFLPVAEVRRVRTHDVPGVETRMKALAALHDAEPLRAALAALPEAYGAWIARARTIPS